MGDLTREERWCAGRKFSRNATNLAHFEMYWVPSIRGVIARSVNATREFRLPPGTISIGIYTHPFSVEDFLGDLEDILAKQRAQRAEGNDDQTLAGI